MDKNNNLYNSMRVEFVNGTWWLTIICKDKKAACINIGKSKLNTVEECLKQAESIGEYACLSDIYEYVKLEGNN